MGFFSLKATCTYCNKEVGMNRFQLKQIKDGWLCPDCLKILGGGRNINLGKITYDELMNIKSEKENSKAKSMSNPLQVAEGMYDYCIANGMGSGFSKDWGIKHFKIIENALSKGETVLLPFIGLHNYVSATKHDNNFAFAVTNRRILIAQAKIMGQTFQTISLDNVNDITLNKGMVFGILTVDTIKETFNIALGKDFAQNICDKIFEVLHQAKASNNPSNVAVQPLSSADEIKKFKELFDMGVITENEFNLKKKELLGL